MYHRVVFIESKWFTKRLHELARGHADEILSAIQNDLLGSTSRGKVVPGLGGREVIYKGYEEDKAI